MNTFKKIIIVSIICIFSFQILNIKTNNSYAEKVTHLENTDISDVINGLFDWEANQTGEEAANNLFGNSFLSAAGSPSSDWFATAAGRYKINDDFSYVAAEIEYINEKYKTSEKLSGDKATEWHRIALTLVSLGYNPEKAGETSDGKDINLLSDGVYNNSFLGKQGINGYIWGLIALDSVRSEIPDGAKIVRKDIITKILGYELEGGGFALSGSDPDPDMTAMALIALAPYKNTEFTYKYTSSVIKNNNGDYAACSKTVGEAVNESLDCISEKQKNNGGFLSWGAENSESASLVITALCSLRINPLTDVRFIKNGNTLYNALLSYRTADGGFKNLPSDIEANNLAGRQALTALISLYRFQNEMRNFYDMQTEFSEEEKTEIFECNEAIDALNENSTETETKNAVSKYNSVPAYNVYYIGNYRLLSSLAKKFNLDLSDYGDELYSGTVGRANYKKILFTSENKTEAVNLPDIGEITTKYYFTVLKLDFLLNNTEDFPEDGNYYADLVKNYSLKLIAVKSEIEDLNASIGGFYPFKNVGLKDEDEIETLIKRYNALSSYDRAQVTDGDYLLKCEEKIKSIKTGIAVGSALGVAAVLTAIFFVLNVRKMKKKKQARKMPESDE